MTIQAPTKNKTAGSGYQTTNPADNSRDFSSPDQYETHEHD